MRAHIYIPVFIITMLSITHCTFDNEEEYFGECNLVDEQGDTLAVFYSDISPVFEGICANCHNIVKTQRTGIVLDSYTNVTETMSKYNDKVIAAIQHTGPYKMPNGQPKLSDCEINKILYWFNSGMPESK